jgi:hypothetical protein
MGAAFQIPIRQIKTTSRSARGCNVKLATAHFWFVDCIPILYSSNDIDDADDRLILDDLVSNAANAHTHADICD